jgi:hypothetical protein
MWVCGQIEQEDIVLAGVKQELFLSIWLVTWSVAWPCSHVKWADEMLCRTEETPLPWKDGGSRSISTSIPSRLHCDIPEDCNLNIYHFVQSVMHFGRTWKQIIILNLLISITETNTVGKCRVYWLSDICCKKCLYELFDNVYNYLLISRLFGAWWWNCEKYRVILF